MTNENCAPQGTSVSVEALLTVSTLPGIRNPMSPTQHLTPSPHPHIGIHGPPPSSVTDPLEPTSHFNEPLLILKESVTHPSQIALHDVIEAYAILSARLREFGEFISPFRRSTDIFFDLSNSLFEALHRDIRFTLNPPRSVSRDPVYVREQRHAELLACHHAINLTAILFSNPNYLQLLRDTHILVIVEDLASVVTANESIQVASPQKELSRVLALNAFSHQKLPALVLSSKSTFEKIAACATLTIRSASISGTKAKLMSFKVLNTLFRCANPFAFKNLVNSAVPIILSNLCSDVPDISSEAAYALTGVVTAHARYSPSPDSTVLSDKIAGFIHSQETSGKVTLVTLSETMRKAIQAGFLDQGKGVIWSFVVSVSLIHLVRDKLFQSVAVTDFFFSVLTRLNAFQDDEALRPVVLWLHCAILFAFSKLVHSRASKKRKTNGISSTQAMNRLFERFRVSHVDIGTIYLATFLHAHSKPLLLPCFRLVKVLASRDDVNAIHAACRLMLQLVDTSILVAAESTLDASFLFCRPLYHDNSIKDVPATLLRSAPSNIREAVQGALPAPDIPACHPLTEQQISSHWSELLDLWNLLANRSLALLPETPSEIVDTWNFLLLSGTDLIHGQGGLQPSVHRLQCVSVVIRDYLVQETTCTYILEAYRLVGRLWHVVVNIYAEPSLSGLAGEILDQMLSFTPPKALAPFEEWCILFRSFIVHVVATKRRDILKRAATLACWAALVRTFQASEPCPDHQVLCDLLIAPYMTSASHPSSAATEQWVPLLNFCVRTGSASRTLDYMAEYAPSILLARCDELFKLLIPSTPLPNVFLSRINRYLQEFYPRQTEQGLNLLKSLGTLFAMQSGHVFHLFQALETGLLVWMRDQQRVVQSKGSDQRVVQLYADILRILEQLEMNAETLMSISPFLVSIFERDTVGTDATDTFIGFWTRTYRSRPDLARLYSDDLKACLSGCEAVFGSIFGFNKPDSIAESQHHMEHSGHIEEGGSELAPPGASLGVCETGIIETDEWSRVIPSLQTRLSRLQRKVQPKIDFSTVDVSFIDTALAIPPSIMGRRCNLFSQHQAPSSSSNSRQKSPMMPVSPSLPFNPRQSPLSSPPMAPRGPHKRKEIFEGTNEAPPLQGVLLTRRKRRKVSSSPEIGVSGQREGEDYLAWEQPINVLDFHNWQGEEVGGRALPPEQQGATSPHSLLPGDSRDPVGPSLEGRGSTPLQDHLTTAANVVHDKIQFIAGRVPDLQTQELWDARMALGKLTMDIDSILDEKDLPGRASGLLRTNNDPQDSQIC